ncbi:hypothetical protein [Micromonospora sp. NPDC049497]|uniref:hypothetical protein n=1 Tax=Micromonospora sp. NPDC049497 TaxID=3364273 RepID=UPI0037A9A655
MSRMMTKKRLLVGLAAAGVLGVGVAAPTVAMAADNGTPSPSASAGEGTDREQRHAERHAAFAEALAKELGVDTDKVTAALEKVREQQRADRPERPDAADRKAALAERLDQAVEDGKLTREQADAITAAAEAGVLGGGPGGHRGK